MPIFPMPWGRSLSTRSKPLSPPTLLEVAIPCLSILVRLLPRKTTARDKPHNTEALYLQVPSEAACPATSDSMPLAPMFPVLKFHLYPFCLKQIHAVRTRSGRTQGCPHWPVPLLGLDKICTVTDCYIHLLFNPREAGIDHNGVVVREFSFFPLDNNPAP